MHFLVAHLIQIIFLLLNLYLLVFTNYKSNTTKTFQIFVQKLKLLQPPNIPWRPVFLVTKCTECSE
uniref:Secreted protein n=1 Tax=Heterorhabditis bacteriophora TaxID=37862 RepID=A0A1I7W8A0_HETBA